MLNLLKTFLITALFFLLLAFSLKTISTNSNNAPLELKVTKTKMYPPINTPTNSAPQVAIDACQNKNVNDKCSFILNSEKLTGNCVSSQETLACTPTPLFNKTQ